MEHEKSAASIEDDRLTALVKRAILEVFRERKDVLREVLEETMEDIVVARAADACKRAEEPNRNRLFIPDEAGK
jgi:hypothetical protein